MWMRIVGSLLLLIVLSFAVQWVLPRSMRTRQGPSRQYLRRDVAPVLGFIGLLLLVLSFVEAFRSGTVLVWGWGGGLGIIASIILWVVLTYLWGQPAPPARKKPSSLGLAIRIIRTYALPFLFLLLGLNVAVRLMGSTVEVFLSGALGIFVIAAAVAIFAGAKPQAT
jgi:hypothetical protein